MKTRAAYEGLPLKESTLNRLAREEMRAQTVAEQFGSPDSNAVVRRSASRIRIGLSLGLVVPNRTPNALGVCNVLTKAILEGWTSVHVDKKPHSTIMGYDNLTGGASGLK